MRIAQWGLAATAILAAAACGTGTQPEPRAPSDQAHATVPSARAGGVGECTRHQPGVGPQRLAAHARQGNTLSLAKSGAKTIAYVADSDDQSLQTMDVDSGRPRATTPLIGTPEQVLVLADGRVAVTIRDKNRVQILEPSADVDTPLSALCTIKTYVEPYGIAATPDDETLVVTSGWARKLAAYDADTMKLKLTRDLPREPRAVLVDDGGRRAFVAHVVGGKISVVDLHGDARDVRGIDLRVKKNDTGSRSKNLKRSSCQGFALAKSVMVDDKGSVPTAVPVSVERPPVDLRTTPQTAPAVPRGRIFAPRVTIDPGDTSRRSSGYGNSRHARIEAPIVSVIDAAAERTMTTAQLPTGNGGRAPRGECLLPRSAAVSQASGGLLVSCLGSNTLVELDPRGADPSRLERRRWSVPAGPTGVAVDDAEARAVVWSQFDRQIAVIDLGMKTAPAKVEVTTAPRLAKRVLTPDESWGRQLFHQTDDKRISRDGRACASCHPDGREDALTWSTPVGPRQTIMLAGRLKGTAPFSWLGSHKDIETHLRITFQRLGGTGLNERDDRVDEMDALVAYLRAMPAPNTKDALIDPRDVALAKRGKSLFFAKEQGCASCHTGARGTDADKHDIGTHTAGDNDKKFDTPSLRFVGGTAPYFHDGRFASLLEVLMATESQMGHTMHLSQADAKALSAYMETL